MGMLSLTFGLVLVLGMTIVGCVAGETIEKKDHSASITVHNDSGITYYLTSQTNPNDNKPRNWTASRPGATSERIWFNVYWNDGETGAITIYFQTQGNNPTSWSSKTFSFFQKNERREVKISSW